MFGNLLLLGVTPHSDLSYQNIHLLSTQAEEDSHSQNLPGVATRREEFSLKRLYSNSNPTKHELQITSHHATVP